MTFIPHVDMVHTSNVNRSIHSVIIQSVNNTATV